LFGSVPGRQCPKFAIWLCFPVREWTWVSRRVLESKIDADGGEVSFVEGGVGEAAEEGGLAYRAVADEDHFK
jgi:hypothetical protein